MQRLVDLERTVEHPGQFEAYVCAKVSQALGQQLDSDFWHAVEPLAQLWFVAQLFVSPAQKVFGQILWQLWGRWAHLVLEFGQLFLQAFAQLLYGLVEAGWHSPFHSRVCLSCLLFLPHLFEFAGEKGCDDDQQQKQRQKHKKE